MADVASTLRNLQVELFQLLAEFFGRATGMPATDFSSIEGFADRVGSEAYIIGHRAEDAFRWADTELRPFYAKKGPEIFLRARQLGGLKLVLGGSSRFQRSQFASVRGALLYADTVLIPDPVFAWMELDRSEEKFRHVLMLQAAHALLHLKPLVDAELPHCPIVVFPSFEKSLEKGDIETLRGTTQLVSDVFANFIDRNISTSADVGRLVHDHPDRFLRGVERHKLYVAPGGVIGEPVLDALKRYEADVRTWRSEAWVGDFSKLPLAQRVLHGVTERLQPHYHLTENADELGAHPLLSVNQQAHYFNIVSQVNGERLERIGKLDKGTQAMLAGLSSPELTFLTNVPVDSLVGVRQNNETEAFRRRLQRAVNDLHEASIEDVARVAAEICREIESGVGDHNRTLKEIDEKFRTKNRQTHLAAGLTGMSFLAPSLAPFIGTVLPLAVAFKYGLDAWEKYDEKRKASRSLMGVLAIAKDQQT